MTTTAKPAPVVRVLVTGGRTYHDQDKVNRTLDRLLADTGPQHRLILITGGALGADRLAQLWAEAHADRVDLIVEKADWLKHGKAAGPIRNQRMLDRHRPQLVIAFPGGKGTAHMCKIADQAGIPVVYAAPPARHRSAPRTRL